ncbi:hypothetical protein AB0N17_40270 [Streptomyces sp. NPDC051133]|uniref:hypothetical protein n=1 Tax=Streptomyces sp. NPDC051133 TaxID=3155521 RepID=UPI003426D194
MPRTPRPTGPDDGRRANRVLAVPVTLLTLVTAFFCWAALVTRPAGPWDDGAYAGIAVACLVALVAATGALGLWLLSRRALGWAWAAPALILAAVAAVRWASIA